MELKTAIIVDPIGSSFGDRTPEDEIKEHVRDFSELLAPAKLNVYTPYSCYPGDLQPGTDLVLFDYGGMLVGNSMAEKNSWYLVTYAADNPSSLVVVVSSFTWGNIIACELEDRQMLGAHNIVPRYWEPKNAFNYLLSDENSEKEPSDFDPIPAWFRDMYGLPRVDPYAEKVKKLRTPKKFGRKPLAPAGEPGEN
jgi:hypothetical protein